MFQEYLKKYRESITENNPNNGICFDGAVDPDSYFGKEHRLAFLLKETNGNKNNGDKNEVLSDWDYMEWVRQQAEGRQPLYRSVYRNIAMWSRMFEVYTENGLDLRMEDYIGEEGLIIDEQMRASLLGIAVVNLKKSWGVERTDWAAMNAYLNADDIRREILLYQIEQLKPTLVMCGGTFDFAKEILGEGCKTENISVNGQNVLYFRRGNTVFVSCYHPSRPGWSRKSSFRYASNIFEALAK